MRVAFNTTKTNIVFIPEGSAYKAEYKYLQDFPGFLKEGPVFYCPAKVHIAFSLFSRIRTEVKNLRVDKEVLEFLKQDFRLKPLPEWFKYHTSPMDYQDIALRYIYTVGSGGLLLDPGMGKSKVVLDYIFLMRFKKAVVACPKALLFVWEDEIATHRPELSYYVVQSTDWQSELEGIQKAEVIIINYNKLVSLQGELMSLKADFIHLDEFLIKDPKSNRTEAATQIGKTIPYRCGGSGTLVNNTILDVFAPVRYLEPALTGGSFSAFKLRYCVFSKTKSGETDSVKFVVGFKKVGEAKSVLDSCCIVMTKDKWLKLPPKNFHHIYVPISEEQRDAYQTLAANYICQIGDEYLEIDNPLVMLSKLYQISNGFVYITPETPEQVTNDLLADIPKAKKAKRKTFFFKKQPKLDALTKLIGEKIGTRRSIIWFNLEAEYTLISTMLTEKGYKFVTIRGGEKDTGGKVRGFNSDPTIQFLLCQAKSVNYGITVLGKKNADIDLEELDPEAFIPRFDPKVHTQIFYSLNYSLEVFLQQQDRIHRLGQLFDCDYYLIFANTSVEHSIRMAIEDKMTLRREVLVDIAEKIRKNPDLFEEPEVPLITN